MAISEITGMESDAVLLQDIFKFVQTGLDEEGRATGYHESCGVRPKCIDRIRSEGHDLPDELFFGGAMKDAQGEAPEAAPPPTTQIRFTKKKGNSK